jgi:predicted nicotinamide N-methyase
MRSSARDFEAPPTVPVLGSIAGVAVQETEVDVDGIAVRLLRAAQLVDHVDAASLLGTVDAAEPPYWMHLWPGAVALARCVAHAGRVGKETHLLEIGCGLALPSIVARRCGARVLATDREELPLHFAAASAARNGLTLHRSRMDWRHPSVRGEFDVCLAADVAYDVSAEDFLVALVRGAVRIGGIAWFADSVNTYRSSLLDKLRAAGFALRVDECCECDEGRPVWVRILEARRQS